MRPWLWMLGLVVGAATFAGSANAQNYPWCAVYGGADSGGASNCGFSTFEQCETSRHGMGGFCQRNTQYVPSSGAYSGPAHRSRR